MLQLACVQCFIEQKMQKIHWNFSITTPNEIVRNIYLWGSLSLISNIDSIHMIDFHHFSIALTCLCLAGFVRKSIRLESNLNYIRSDSENSKYDEILGLKLGYMETETFSNMVRVCNSKNKLELESSIPLYFDEKCTAILSFRHISISLPCQLRNRLREQ